VDAEGANSETGRRNQGQRLAPPRNRRWHRSPCRGTRRRVPPSPTCWRPCAGCCGVIELHPSRGYPHECGKFWKPLPMPFPGQHKWLNRTHSTGGYVTHRSSLAFESAEELEHPHVRRIAFPQHASCRRPSWRPDIQGSVIIHLAGRARNASKPARAGTSSLTARFLGSLRSLGMTAPGTQLSSRPSRRARGSEAGGERRDLASNAVLQSQTTAARSLGCARDDRLRQRPRRDSSACFARSE